MQLWGGIMAHSADNNDRVVYLRPAGHPDVLETGRTRSDKSFDEFLDAVSNGLEENNWEETLFPDIAEWFIGVVNDGGEADEEGGGSQGDVDDDGF